MQEIAAIKDKREGIVFRNRALAKSSKESYTEGVRQYLDYLKETGQAESVESVRAWLKEVRKTKSPATFNLRAQALKDYLLKKYEHDYKQLFGVQELFKSIKPYKVEKSILQDEYLTYDDVMELSEKVTERMSLIVQALFWTGCRVSELVAIKLDDVTVNDKAIIRVKAGKGRKEHTVYLPLALYTKIRDVLKGKEYLFETQGSKPYHRVNLYKEISRQAKKHGYTIHPHSLRHSKAMYLKDERRLTPDQIAKALGHSDVAITLRSYFHGTPSAEEQGIE